MPRVPAKRIRHFHSTPRFNSVEFAMFSAFGHPSECWMEWNDVEGGVARSLTAIKYPYNKVVFNSVG